MYPNEAGCISGSHSNQFARKLNPRTKGNGQWSRKPIDAPAQSASTKSGTQKNAGH